MTISFKLNGKDVAADVRVEERLINILRRDFKLKGAKSACKSGSCGCCSVIFNNTVVPACQIPAFRAGGANIVTIEGFEKTPEYGDITGGLLEAGAENCACCESAKILVMESLLKSKKAPAEEAVRYAFDSIKCRCNDAESLVRGVFAAYKIRKKRKGNG